MAMVLLRVNSQFYCCYCNFLLIYLFLFIVLVVSTRENESIRKAGGVPEVNIILFEILNVFFFKKIHFLFI